MPFALIGPVLVATLGSAPAAAATVLHPPTPSRVAHRGAATSPAAQSPPSGWSIVSSQYSGTNDRLYSVTCVNAADCWAVGDSFHSGYSVTFAEQNTGSGWTIVTTPNPTLNATFDGVTCVSTTDCWAVGSYVSSAGKTLTLIEQYTTSGWAIVSSPNLSSSSDLLSVACVGASDCWAVGDNGLTEQYTGSTWGIVTSPNFGSLTGVTCPSATDCWAVGSIPNLQTGSTDSLIEQNTGAGWTVVNSPNPSASRNLLRSVTCVSTTDCWTTGNEQDATLFYKTLTEQNTGTGWTVVGSPTPTSGDNILNSVTCINAADCWAAGSSETGLGTSQPLIEQNAGHGWAVIGSPDTNSSDYDLLSSVTCPGAADCRAVGSFTSVGVSSLIEQYVPPIQQPPSGGPVASPELLGGTNCACANANLGQSYSGDPVDTAYGNFTESYTDLSIPGRGIPLQFARTYNSLMASSPGPLGYGWTLNGLMSLSPPVGSGPATVTQEGGAQVAFSQNGSTFTPVAPRITATLVHNADMTWTFVRSAQNTSTFSPSGQLVSQMDRNGYAITFGYNGTNQLTTLTDSTPRTIAIGWTGNNITSVTDSNVSPNRIVTFQYNDGRGDLTDILDVNGGHTHLGYDTTHHLTNLLDPNCYAAGAACNTGNGVVNGYDGVGRTTSQHDQLGRNTTFGYVGDPGSAAGGTTTITDPKGNVTLDDYQYGLLTSRTEGYGTSATATWQYLYDPITAARVSNTDPNGHTTTYAVDANGNQLTQADPLGRQRTATYNSLNEPLTRTDGTNVTTTYTYDGNGNELTRSTPLVGANPPANQVITYNYADAAHLGDVTSMVDADGKVWLYGYDSHGYRNASTDPLGNKGTSTFNAVGWKLTDVSPSGNVSGCGCASQYTSTYGYIIPVSGLTDNWGDVQTITDPLGHATTDGYDQNRNQTSIKDADGHVTTYVYDLAGQKTSAHRADTTTMTTDYNLDGTIADEKDGKNSPIQTYGYNSLAQITSVKDALGNESDYVYDGAGNQLTIQAPGGNCTSHTRCTTNAYDASNELTSVLYSDGATANVASIVYDADGQKTSWTDGSGAWIQVFDSLHRLTSVTEGGGGVVAYAYNLRNLTTKITYPYPGNAHVVAETYDDAGRWTKVQDWNGNATNIGYDHNSNLTTYALPAATAITDTLGYNKANNLVSISDKKNTTAFFSATYGHDSAGWLTSDTSAPAAQGKYRYTAIAQVCYAGSANSTTCGSPPTGAEAFAYDAAGNPTKLNPTSTTQQFNTADEMCWSVSGSSSNPCGTLPAGATSYAYDASGNRTAAVPSSGSATCQAYDQANRVVQAAIGTGSSCTSPTTLGNYSYNATGLRMSKTVSGSVTTETWNEASALPLLLEDSAPGSTLDYIYGPGGRVLEQVAGSTALWYHHDQVGSTRAITDGAGATKATYQYDPYGNEIATTGTVANPFLYAGQYRDAETSLYYLRARYYDPHTAQFMSRDPMVSTTHAPYGYAGGSPLNASDPSGLYIIGCFMPTGTPIDNGIQGPPDLPQFAYCPSGTEVDGPTLDGGPLIIPPSSCPQVLAPAALSGCEATVGQYQGGSAPSAGVTCYPDGFCGPGIDCLKDAYACTHADGSQVCQYPGFPLDTVTSSDHWPGEPPLGGCGYQGESGGHGPVRTAPDGEGGFRTEGFGSSDACRLS
jgi:RHS repeat-associated protein